MVWPAAVKVVGSAVLTRPRAGTGLRVTVAVAVFESIVLDANFAWAVAVLVTEPAATSAPVMV